MKWQMYRWVWKVRSPLHIGTAPAGSLNRTRLYIPARTLWGAFTAELSRSNAGSNFPKYEEEGKKLWQETRFSYLFPARLVDGRWLAWYPRYSKEGLKWYLENDTNKSIPDCKFRTNLLSTYPSTAIDPITDTAAEGTLRELECIQTHWRSEDTSDASEVAMVGYVFFKNEYVKNKVFSIRELLIGADTRYGYGRLTLEEKGSASELFGKPVDLTQKEHPRVCTDVVLGHTKIDVNLQGSFDLLEGQDRGNVVIIGLTWAPGSCASKSLTFEILPGGIWQPVMQGA